MSGLFLPDFFTWRCVPIAMSGVHYAKSWQSDARVSSLRQEPVILLSNEHTTLTPLETYGQKCAEQIRTVIFRTSVNVDSMVEDLALIETLIMPVSQPAMFIAIKDA